MRIVVLGEGMVELAQPNDTNHWRVGYGGDTLNTAIHLARLGQQVAYVTALGTDSFSGDLCSAWKTEGLDTSLILTHPDCSVGLYAIRTDAHGERSFTYWRDSSAAKYLFALPQSESLTGNIETADLFFFSLISLAVLPPEGRRKLLDIAHAVRDRGGRVAFDSNYRPRLWKNSHEAATMRDEALKCCDIGLPTLEDEHMLSGLTDSDEVIDYWQDRGVKEIIVKLGAQGCRIDSGKIIAPLPFIKPVDTSGAGDAFNAAYLHARLNHMSIEDSALAGHRLAGWVVTQSGAIPKQNAEAPY